MNKVFLLASLLAALAGCHPAPPANTGLVGRWQIDSIASVSVGSAGRVAGAGRTERPEFYLYVTPTHLRVFVPLFPDDDSVAYVQRGDSVVVRGPGKREESWGRIALLSPTALIITKTDALPHSNGTRIRSRWYYHRQSTEN